ncbi:AMP-binding protein [Gordonia rubripertincta]|uniref:AMP-binding protein n=1 Tax=Gordonia rubripertincta TaxID=36822 RepID=A0ABT4MNM5_GORRU|nr:AMP-binding protein [Gordonia rubripertincta]MCZ4548599.1 AMP-binding protein [Gordonia rubripertincta]
MHTSLSLPDVVDENRRGRPGALALVDGDRRFTYDEFGGRTERVARALGNRGVTAGDRILWLGANSHRVLELLVAAGRIGAVLCPINWRQSPDEISFVLDDLEPRVVVFDPALFDGRKVPGSEWIASRGGADDEYELLLESGTNGLLPDFVAGEQPVLLLYTAAFQGRPNGALLSHRALVSHAMSLGVQRRVDDNFVFLNSGPLFHIGTVMFACAAMVFGGTNVMMAQFDAESACRLIETEKCTGAMLFGLMIEQMVAVNQDRRFDLSSLRFSPVGSEWDQMITPDDSPWGLSNAGYGQTEVGGMLTFHALGMGGIGTHGRSSPLCQIRILDDDGVEVSAGQTGEMVARGAHLFDGYFNRPELNHERFRDGWYHTNDLGRREADGTITFIGPKARMIKSGGENIYPADVERVLTRHPAVLDAAVIGVPDSRWGQSVVAVVVADKGAVVDEAGVIDHVRSHAASYKKPRSVIFVEAIPKLGYAADYDLLDEQYGGGGYPGSGAAVTTAEAQRRQA